MREPQTTGAVGDGADEVAIERRTQLLEQGGARQLEDGFEDGEIEFAADDGACSDQLHHIGREPLQPLLDRRQNPLGKWPLGSRQRTTCLLYTSDAADE